MTEQEAEAYAARLARVWEPDKGSEKHSIRHHMFYFVCWVKGNELQLRRPLTLPSGKAPLKVRLYCGHGTHLTESAFIDFFGVPSELICFSSPFIKGNPQFFEDWLPLFSRGCWLSGCDIEASAHEKAEWVQGFSCQEVEAWNLKM